MKNPVLPLSLAFLSGIIAASRMEMNVTQLFFVSALFVSLSLFFIKRKMLSEIFLCILVIVTGMVHYTVYNKLPEGHLSNKLSSVVPRVILLKGVIVSEPVFERKVVYLPEMRFLIKVQSINTASEWENSRGLVSVNAYYNGKEILEYGDNVVVKGKIMYPYSGGEFDYKSFLNRKRIHFICRVGNKMFVEKIPSRKTPYVMMRRFLYSVKDKARREFLINLNPPHFAVLIAMLLGDRHFLSSSIKEVFVHTGTLHILAISGLHIGIIVFIFLGFFKIVRIPDKQAAVLAIALILVYALMIDERASVWRATVMAVTFLFAFILDRQRYPMNNLGISLLILLLWNPNYIFDVGFILSFACIFSILYITPFFDKLCGVNELKTRLKISGKAKLLLPLAKSVSISASVWIGILPIIGYYFHIITPITIVANLIAVPLCFAMVTLGIVSLLFSFLIPVISFGAYEVIQLLDNVLLGILSFLSNLPGAYFKGVCFTPFWVFVYYVLLVVILLWLKTGYSSQQMPYKLKVWK